jgi:hypothetical protein
MNGVQYVILAYSFALVLLGGYSITLLVQSRRHAAQDREINSGHSNDS